MSEIKIKIAAGTNVGLVRQNNEDNFIVCSDLVESQWDVQQDKDYIDLGEYGALLVVADGMGGANAGEVASEIAVQMVRDSFVPEEIAKVIGSDEAMLSFEKKVVKAADVTIVNTSKSNKETEGMGTTIVLAWVYQKKAYICWCGDSRCYVFNPNVGLTRLSKDHSFVQELVDKGELDQQYASDHPLSNVITRCLGDTEKHASPDTRIYDVHTGDILLLCTDGLSGPCSDDDIMQIVNENQDDINECLTALVGGALMGGGHDNVTVALCAIKLEDEESDDMTRTIVPTTVGRKIPLKLILLLVLIAAAIYIYTAPHCEPLRQQINTAASGLFLKVKGWFSE
jgi:protein phosphatase